MTPPNENIKVLMIGSPNPINNRLCELINVQYQCRLISPEIRGNSEISFNKTTSINQPDVIVVNLLLIQCDHLDLLSALRNVFKNTPVIGVHTFNVRKMVDKLIEGGYSGYTTIFSFSDEFEEAIAQVLSKKIYISSEVT